MSDQNYTLKALFFNNKNVRKNVRDSSKEETRQGQLRMYGQEWNLVLQLYDQFGLFTTGRRNGRWKHLLWHATCWCMWNARNNIDIICPDQQFDGSQILEKRSKLFRGSDFYTKGNTSLLFSFPLGATIICSVLTHSTTKRFFLVYMISLLTYMRQTLFDVIMHRYFLPYIYPFKKMI